jgi:hypothetical protein
MTNEQIKQEVREAIAKEIADYEPGTITYSRALIMANSILSLKTENWSIGIVDEKGELPENPYFNDKSYDGTALSVGYNKAQQDMAGYRKII